jgi:hypothetical protein
VDRSATVEKVDRSGKVEKPPAEWPIDKIDRSNRVEKLVPERPTVKIDRSRPVSKVEPDDIADDKREAKP